MPARGEAEQEEACTRRDPRGFSRQFDGMELEIANDGLLREPQMGVIVEVPDAMGQPLATRRRDERHERRGGVQCQGRILARS